MYGHILCDFEVFPEDRYYCTIKPAFKGHCDQRTHFLRTVSYLPHIKELVMNGHLLCMDTFCDIELFPEDRFYCTLLSYTRYIDYNMHENLTLD